MKVNVDDTNNRSEEFTHVLEYPGSWDFPTQNTRCMPGWMHKDHSLLEIFSEPPSIYRGECYLTTGLCSNALAFANASANAAFALAFDSLWRLHLHLYLHLIHPHLHLHLIQMHLIESNSNQMPLYYYCFMMVISLLGFFWNKPEEDQYKNLWLQCLKVTMHT